MIRDSRFESRVRNHESRIMSLAGQGVTESDGGNAGAGRRSGTVSPKVDERGGFILRARTRCQQATNNSLTVVVAGRQESGGRARVALTPDSYLLGANEHHVRDGEVLRVCQRQQRAGCAHPREARSRAAMKSQLRRASGADDLDVAPAHAARAAGSERLHRRLLGRESRGKRRCEVTPGAAIGDFTLGEDPLDEALAVTADRLRDPVNLGRIEAKSYNVHTCNATSGTRYVRVGASTLGTCAPMYPAERGGTPSVYHPSPPVVVEGRMASGRGVDRRGAGQSGHIGPGSRSRGHRRPQRRGEA